MPSAPAHPLRVALDAMREGTPGRADHLLDTAARSRSLAPPSDTMLQQAWSLFQPDASPSEVARWLRWMELAGVDPRRVRDRLAGPVVSVPLGSFILEDPIGTGASGEVFRARHLHGGFAVAIKRLAHLTPIQSLEREAQAIAALDHPAVVRLMDVGTVGPVAAAAHGGLDPGQTWVALELVEGRDLQAWLENEGDGSALGADVMLGLLERLASGLAHAHARDVLHLDIKPANVLVGQGLDDAKLCDFGLATLAEDERRRRAAGSPSFMAPEQCRADWRAFGPHTDVYGLGCLAVWLIEGRPLYGGASIHTILDLQVNGPVPDLSPRSPIPDGLRSWVRRCLEKRPVDRFRTAVGALQALRQVRGTARSLPALPRADGVRGRSAARSALWDAFSRCVASNSTERVLLRSAPGLGRTTLLRWLQRAVREHSDVRALYFDGARGGRAAFRETFGRALKTHGLSGRACVKQVRRASGVPTGVVAELMSEALVDGPVRGAALELLRAWLAVGPVVLLFDDADSAWLHWLSAQNLDGGLLLVASLPEDGAGARESELLAPDWETTDLDPLPDRVMAWLLHDERGLEAALAEQLAPRLGGNPAWAEEVLSRWADAGWLAGTADGRVLRSSLDEAFEAMAEVEPMWTAVAGDAQTRRAFEVFAQLGLRVDRAVLEAVWSRLGLDVDEDALRRAGDWGRIRELDGTLGFVRPWEREQLRAIAGQGDEARVAHEVCAEVLEARDQLGDAGRQWIAAGRPDRAIPAMLSSALHHARVGEPALALAELAVLEGQSLDREATWGAKLARAMVADAYWRREEAVELAAAASGDPRPERRVEALLISSRNLSPLGRHPEALSAVTRAVELGRQTPGFDPDLLGRALWNLAFARKYAGHTDGFQAGIADARAQWARCSGPSGRARSVQAHAAEAVGAGRFAEAAAAYEEAATLYLDMGARRQAVRALHLASAARRWNDEPELAWPLELSGLAIADTDLADRYRSSLVSLAIASGDRDRARRELSTWALLPGRSKLLSEAAHQAMMRVAIDGGELEDEALDELLERIDEGDAAGFVHPAELGWHLAAGAIAAREAGRLDRARALAERSRQGWVRQGVDRAPVIDG